MWIAGKNWHGTHYFFEVDVFEDQPEKLRRWHHQGESDPGI